ncbi:MAG: 4-oxalocrotonate tautomerase family protein [Candidatus Bathyarchaeia archaeon]
MPVVHVYALKGYSSEAKKRVIAGITRVFVELGLPAEAVHVLIHEVPREDWGMGGELASEKLKHIQLP